MAKFKIQHITKYSYEVPVRDSANQIMLYPISDAWQEISMHRIRVTGNPAIEIHSDVFGNKIGTFTHSKPHQELIIDSSLEVITRNKELPEDKMDVNEQWKMLEKIRNEIPYIDFLRLESFQSLSEVTKIIEEVRCKNCTPLITARDYCSYVFENFT